MFFEYQCLRLFLVLFLLILSNGFAFAENDLVPEDECILELTLPEGASVKVDGEDYGTQREITFSPLERLKNYKSRMTIRYLR
tara:strand:+ start:1106 stop:1354 length:249 start_codon:yes stop_codon:yes gene_type:complete